MHTRLHATLQGIFVLLAPSACWAPLAAEEGALPPLVTPDQVAAVDRGLSWLASQQRSDGSWGGSVHGQEYPITMTALAGLALVAGGHTPTRGLYADKVANAIKFLLDHQSPETGHFLGDGEQRSMYGHGYTMLFLGTVYGMTGPESSAPLEERIRQALVRAIERTRTAQTDTGGFGYTPQTGGSDEGSVTVTQIQGVRACMDAGVDVPSSIIDESHRYLATCQNPDGGIRYRAVQDQGPSRPALTTAACATLYNQSRDDDQVTQNCLRYVRDNMLGAAFETGEWNHQWFFYTHFYLAQVLFVRGAQEKDHGREDWESYYPRLRQNILGRQDADGTFTEDRNVAPTFNTALGVLILTLPYQRIPIMSR